MSTKDVIERLDNLAIPVGMYNTLSDVRAELIRLQEIEKAAQELTEDLCDWSSAMTFSAKEPTVLLSYRKLVALLEGKK